MDEKYILDNGIIKQAIEKYNRNANNMTLLTVIKSTVIKMDQNGRLLIPVEATEEDLKALNLENTTQGEIITTDKDFTFKLRTLTLKDGKTALAAFTDIDETSKGASTHTISCTIQQFFKSVESNSEVAGVIINPWGKSCFLPVDIVKKMLAMYHSPMNKSQIYFEKGDITKLDCDCIVNAANKSLLGGGGVDGAIHKASGAKLLKECMALKGCETGEAKITKGYKLPAPYIIHTVGPIYKGTEENVQELQNCYRNSLDLARDFQLHSIAFPAISTGAYGYPVKESCAIALHTITQWLNDNSDYPMSIIMSCFNDEVLNGYQEYVATLNNMQ